MFLLSVLSAPAMIAGLLLADPESASHNPKEWNPVIDPSTFASEVTSPYFPLVPGTVMEYSGTTRDGNETLRVEVTRRHKTILGVATTVVIETASLDGEVIEIAENWFAQDGEGNVWYFGEFTQDFQGGNPTGTAGSWEAGVNDARPGIIMLAHPNPGDTYYQEFAPDVAQDLARVMKIDEALTVPYGSYTGVLVTKEWNPLDPGNPERKYYAPGVGLIQDDVLTLNAVYSH